MRRSRADRATAGLEAAEPVAALEQPVIRDSDRQSSAAASKYPWIATGWAGCRVIASATLGLVPDAIVPFGSRGRVLLDMLSGAGAWCLVNAQTPAPSAKTLRTSSSAPRVPRYSPAQSQLHDQRARRAALQCCCRPEVTVAVFPTRRHVTASLCGVAWREPAFLKTLRSGECPRVYGEDGGRKLQP